MTALHRRLFILILLLLAGFAVRLHQLTAPDLNIDETWSYLYSYFLAYPSGYTVQQILSPEPNNAIHLILLAANLTILEGRFAVRWLSVIAGILTVALTARAAFRLSGNRAAVIAAAFMAFAYAPVVYSQIARPYAMATMFAALSLVFWLEKRPRLNMVASTLVMASHPAAMPVVIMQDVMTLWRIQRRQRVNKLDWIVRRVPVYGVLLLILYMQMVRRDQHVASGQTPPGLDQLLFYTLNVIHGGFPNWSIGTLLFTFGVVVPIVLVAVKYRSRLKNLSIPLLWIGLTYALLATAAIFSDGPIKWIHITHVAVPICIIIAIILAQASRPVRWFVLCANTLAAVILLTGYYNQPYRYIPDTLLDSLRTSDEPLYAAQVTVLWTLQVNNPEARYIQLLPDTNYSSPYLYAEMHDWLPEAPPECDPEPLWQDGTGLQILSCNT